MPVKQPKSGLHRKVRGATLIEVLVAVLVMAIGMLGIAAMQAAALRNSQSALERSQGVINTYAILDAMRANREAAMSGAYNIGKTCDASGAGSSLIQDDINFWLSNLETNLGEDGACGTISCAAGICTITVEWDDTRGTGNFEDLGFTTEVAL